MEIFHELGDDSGAAWSLNQHGDVAREQGDAPALGHSTKRRSWRFASAGTAGAMLDRWLIWASIDCEWGDHASAMSAYRESLEIFTSLEHRRGIARVLEGLACLALSHGDTLRAISIAAAAMRLRQQISAPLPPAEQRKVRPTATARLGIGRRAGGQESLGGRRQKCPWRARFNSRWPIGSRLREFLRPDEPSYCGNPAGRNLGPAGVLENQVPHLEQGKRSKPCLR